VIVENNKANVLKPLALMDKAAEGGEGFLAKLSGGR